MNKSVRVRIMSYLGGSLLVAAMGCAAAYHDYPCGVVPLDYCPPAPLPYTGFSNCPTPIAQEYVSDDESKSMPPVGSRDDE